MITMRTALLICADDARSRTIIHALKSEHDIWHVARQRDAMAYLTKHQPETVVIDLDFLGHDAVTIVETIRMSDAELPSFVIGVSKKPELLDPSLTCIFDQILAHS
jgi:DNA-binding NtrC family response regulator